MDKHMIGAVLLLGLLAGPASAACLPPNFTFTVGNKTVCRPIAITDIAGIPSAPLVGSTGKGLVGRTLDPKTLQLTPAGMLEAIVGGSGTTPPPPGPAFYVSAAGSDSNPGTLAAPFATIPRAQTAMQGSSTKLTYVRGGAYTPTPTSSCNGAFANCLYLITAADNGETFSYYPPDGVDSADITGGSTSSSNGTATLFVLYGVTGGFTVNGLKLHNFQYAAMASVNGGVNTGITFENNLVYNQFDNFGTVSNAAGFQCYGCLNATISHNAFHDMAGAAWSVSSGGVGPISGLVIDSNVAYTTCTVTIDCGADYIQDVLATSTNIADTNNFIRDGNTVGSVGGSAPQGSGGYLDDCTSNVTRSGNIITGHNGGFMLYVHGGLNNKITGNIIDFTTYQDGTNAWDRSGASGCSTGTMSGNTFQHNILISKGGGGGFPGYNSPVNPPTIGPDSYWNYAGSAIATSGCGAAPCGGTSYSDATPTTQDPLISSCYVVSPSSPALGSPTLFPGITGGWGPPGYTIPPATGGSVPSYAAPTC